MTVSGGEGGGGRWKEVAALACSPMMEPGRMMRSQAMASRAAKPCVRIMCAAISVPVRPSPACPAPRRQGDSDKNNKMILKNPKSFGTTISQL